MEKNINNEFAGASLTLGQANAIVKKLGGMEGVKKFLRGEITVAEPARSWREHDGVIYFSVISNGKTGQEWLDHFDQTGVQISNWAKSIILHADFNKTVTNDVVTEIVVLKGMLWNDADRITTHIRAEAEKRQLYQLSPEHVCLMRDKLSDADLQEMGLNWIVGMHELIPDSDGDLSVLSLGWDSDGPWLYTPYDKPGDRWNRDNGFAFAVSQVDLAT